MSKLYDRVVSTFKKLSSSASAMNKNTVLLFDKDNFDMVAEVRKEMKTMSPQELAKMQNGLKVILERIEQTTKNLNTLYDIVRKDHLPQTMDDNELDLFVIPEVGRITLQSDIYLSYPAAHKEELYDWLEENGHGELIKSNVHAGTLKAFVKDYLKKDTTQEGYVELPEFLKITPYSFSKVTRITPKS